jgi:hypothetical protein
MSDEEMLHERLAELLAHFRAQRIALNVLSLEIEHEGVALRGRLYYWSKDWFAVLEEPVFAFGPDGHLMAGAPVRYVASGESAGEGVLGKELPAAEVLAEAYRLVSPRSARRSPPRP